MGEWQGAVGSEWSMVNLQHLAATSSPDQPSLYVTWLNFDHVTL